MYIGGFIMAFVNRKFTEQEKVEIDQKKIRNFKENHLCYVIALKFFLGGGYLYALCVGFSIHAHPPD